MVLRTFLLMSFVACSHSTPVRPGSAGIVSLALVVDGLEKAPEKLTRSLQGGLANLGYQVSVVPSHHFAGHGSSAARRRILSQRALAKSHHLLVELAAEATSQMGGAYRWEVTAGLSLVPMGDQKSLAETSFHVPVFRQHETDGVVDVIGSALPAIVERVHPFIALHRSGSGPEQPAAETQIAPSRQPIYLVMVDRFANGNTANDGDADPTEALAFNGGDLQGVLDHLGWIQDLGMGQVWLTPLAKGRKTPFMGHGAFHGYWTEDLREWETRFGDDQVGVAFRKELDRRGMRLILDLVVNHVDYDAPLVEQQPHWFHQAGNVVDFRDPVQRVTGRVHGLPDLDQDVPEVFAYLSSAARSWHDRLQPEGYRLDAIQHVAANFTKPYGDLLRSLDTSEPVVLGEIFEGDVKSLSEGIVAHGLDQAFDFPFYYALKSVFCDGAPFGRIAAVFGVDGMYPDANQLVTFVDNHDLPRIQSACAGDAGAVDRALTTLFSSRGIPAITYGTEVGLAGAEEPANRGVMRFVRHPLRNRIAKLAQLRMSRPALHSGATRILEIGDEHLVVVRHLAEDGVALVLNHGDTQVDVSLPKGLVVGQVLDGQPAVGKGKIRVGAKASALVEVGGAYLSQMEPKKMKVLIEIGQLPDPAASYRLVGLGSDLGHWQPENGVPVKSGRAVLETAADRVVEFKLVQLKQGRALWEPRENRYLHVGSSPQTVAVQWGR